MIPGEYFLEEGDIEANAGRFRFGDVDDHDISQFFLGDLAGNGRANVSGAANDCHFALHESPSRLVVGSWWLVVIAPEPNHKPLTTNC